MRWGYRVGNYYPNARICVNKNLGFFVCEKAAVNVQPSASDAPSAKIFHVRLRSPGSWIIVEANRSNCRIHSGPAQRTLIRPFEQAYFKGGNEVNDVAPGAKRRPTAEKPAAEVISRLPFLSDVAAYRSFVKNEIWLLAARFRVSEVISIPLWSRITIAREIGVGLGFTRANPVENPLTLS